MSNSKLRKLSGYNHDVKNYTKGTPVKITKGSLKGCKGKISGFTSSGFYFIARDWCDKDADGIYSPINFVSPDEFERSD